MSRNGHRILQTYPATLFLIPIAEQIAIYAMFVSPGSNGFTGKYFDMVESIWRYDAVVIIYRNITTYFGIPE